MAEIEEIFDVCDENDRAIGRAPRSVVHARKLLHRAVHIFVFNSGQQLLLQRRSATKDECPLLLTSSASGHLHAGESYEHAAIRELREELGLAGDLQFQVKLGASAETSYEHTALYTLTTDQPPFPDPDEILGMEPMQLQEIQEKLIEEPDDFSPALRTLLHWYIARFAS